MKNIFKIYLVAFLVMFTTTAFAEVVKYENKDTSSVLFGSYLFDTDTKTYSSVNLTINFSPIGFDKALPAIIESSGENAHAWRNAEYIEFPPENDNLMRTLNGLANVNTETPDQWTVFQYFMVSNYKQDVRSMSRSAYTLDYVEIPDYGSAEVSIRFSKAVVPVPEPLTSSLMVFGISFILARRKFS